MSGISTGTAILGASLVGTTGSLISGMSSGGQADAYAGQAGTLANTQAGIAQAQWDRYIKQFAPLENKLIYQVSKPLNANPAFLSSMAGVRQNYGNIGANTRRMMAGRYPSGSELETAGQAQNQRSMIKTLADTRAQGEQNRLNQMYQTLGLGRNLPTSAMAGMNSAAGTYGNLATMYGNAANSAYSSAGNSLGNMAQMYMLNQYMNKGTGGGNPMVDGQLNSYFSGGYKNGMMSWPYSTGAGAWNP